ncbi:hypothetical protein SUGI_0008220 [Cryptomeria japonica]|uniref:uncharacterized protein LOC131063222 isoform X2 n=1 Tax=Cryptomeria japonica TaxID=3369 RepID=UPI002408B36F|nr:uncharacterized protein LOC131063222 isoform X2 [Cryptomeria japonica]GLJ04979.1 hypothetical protein SUGI_0008220 [Cryptomeria japonica]
METITFSSYTSISSASSTPKSLQLIPIIQQSSTARNHTLHSKPATVRVNATAGKGFGKSLRKKSNRMVKESTTDVCPCGGGRLNLEYEKCCKPFHDGIATEPDALTLMKARFTAYANGVVDYIVKTTHPQNPDYSDADVLAADVRATCARLLFTKLEILESENLSENEARVLFKVTYLSRNSNKGVKNFLVELSGFVQEGDRWLYMERLPLPTTKTSSTNTNFIQAELARKAYNSSRQLPNPKAKKK